MKRIFASVALCLPLTVYSDNRESHATVEDGGLIAGEVPSGAQLPYTRNMHNQSDRPAAYQVLHSKFRESGYESKGSPQTSERRSPEAVTASYFSNKYTFEIIDAPALPEGELGAIEANARAVIEYVSDYISWRGTLDFAVQFRPFDYWDVGGKGLLPSLGGVASSGYTWAAEEALTGVDANGDAPDIGCYILPHEDGRLTNYDTPLSFDPSPDFYEAYVPPTGTHDFASIFLHEILHSLAFWSAAQHGDQYQRTVFDDLTIPGTNNYEFIGGATNTLLNQNLNLAYEGSRDHYGTTRALEAGGPEVERGAMYMFGNYEKNRWHLGKLELAVMEDIGFTVANAHYLNLVEQPEAEVKEAPAQPSKRSQKAFSNLLNAVKNHLGG